MKLIIQIPCFNEAEILPVTLAALPRRVDGFNCVEFMVIDDGSTDSTSAVARSCGVNHIVRLSRNAGLACAFMTGLDAAIKCGADVIVNTDADNQYNAANIPDLLAPILKGEADMVIGARPMSSNPHFSLTKRTIQIGGTKIVRGLVGADIKDATSGFRAFTAHSALKLNVFGHFTYTLETIFQAALNNLKIVSVPVGINGPTRPSRLFRSNLCYIVRSILTIIAVLFIYRPFKFFALLSAGCLIPGIALSVRYILLMSSGDGIGHVQSVIASGFLITCGVFLAVIAVVTHLQSINRRILEDIKYGQRVWSLENSRTSITLDREGSLSRIYGESSIQSTLLQKQSVSQ